MERSQAVALDQQDPLREFKKRFVITDPDTCYLDGNSLGRLPHETVKAINDFLSYLSLIHHLSFLRNTR